MKTAVVGLGNIGARVARHLVEGGIDVIVSQRNLGKAQAFAEAPGAKARALPAKEAVETADVIILAIWFDAIKSFVAEHRAALSGKVVVDPSNPVAPDGNDGFKKTIAQDQSSGEIIAAQLPPDAELVKAFGTLSGGSLASASTGSRRKQSFSMRPTMPRPAPPYKGSSARAGLTRCGSAASISRSASRSSAISMSSGSSAASSRPTKPRRWSTRTASPGLRLRVGRAQERR